MKTVSTFFLQYCLSCAKFDCFIDCTHLTVKGSCKYYISTLGGWGMEEMLILVGGHWALEPREVILKSLKNFKIGLKI